MVGMRIFGGGGGRESKGVTLFPGAWCLFLFVYSREFPGIKRRCGFGGLILIASNPPYQQWVSYVYVLRFVLRLSPRSACARQSFILRLSPQKRVCSPMFRLELRLAQFQKGIVYVSDVLRVEPPDVRGARRSGRAPPDHAELA